MTYAGAPDGADLVICPREGAGSRPATAAERAAIRVAVLAERVLRDEVLCRDSALVDDLLRRAYEHGDDLGNAFGIEAIENLVPDPDTMTPEELRAYVDERGGTVPDRPEAITCPACAGDDDTCARCEGQGLVLDPDADEDDDYLDALRDAVRDCAEPVEIYEWWRVSGWLAEHLRAIGEPVLDNDYGTWWGRTCTGQGVIMDGTLQRVAARIVGGAA